MDRGCLYTVMLKHDLLLTACLGLCCPTVLLFSDVYSTVKLQLLVPLTGDLHFYMRHSFCPFRAAAPQPPSQAAAHEAGVQTDCKAASEAPSVVSQTSSSYATPSMAEASRSTARKGPAKAPPSQATNGLSHNHSFNFGPSLHAAPAELPKSTTKHAQHDVESAGPSSTAVHLRVSTGQHLSHPSLADPAPASYASSTTSATSADDSAEVQGGRGSGDGVSSSGQSTSSGWHPHDPEHLIVNGLGGAFLHPTHVFSPSRFVSGMHPPPPPPPPLLSLPRCLFGGAPPPPPAFLLSTLMDDC